MQNGDNIKLEKRLDFLEEEIRQIRSQLQNQKAESNITNTIKKSKIPEKLESTASKTPKKSHKSIEDFLGSNLIGKLGAFALILTAGWFVKHAIDKQWLNASVRIILGITFGFLLTGVALQFAKKKYKLLWPVTAGSGYAIVYISLYAAYYFYGFFGIAESFILLFVLSALIVCLAMYSGSEVVFSFSLLGVFLIPLIHSQNQNSYRFLFSYISIVNIIYVITALKYAWRTSGYVFWSLLGLVISIWAADKLDSSSGLIVLLFLVVNIILLLIRQLYLFPRKNIQSKVADPILVFLVSLFVLGLGLNVMNVHYFEWRALWLLAIISLTGFIMHRIWVIKKIDSNLIVRHAEKLWSIWTLLFISSLSFSGIFLVFDASWWVAGSLAFSGAWLFISARLDFIPMNIAGLVFWMITAGLLLFAIDLEIHFYAFFNQRFLLFIICAVILAMSWFAWQNPPQIWLRAFWPFCAIPVIIIATFFEFYNMIESNQLRNLSYSMILIFYAIVFLLPGFWKNLKYFRYAGLAIISALILKFYFYDIWQLKTGVRIIVGLSSGIVLMLFSYFYQKFFRLEEVQK